jgi:hypothetical protein
VAQSEELWQTGGHYGRMIPYHSAITTAGLPQFLNLCHFDKLALVLGTHLEKLYLLPRFKTYRDTEKVCSRMSRGSSIQAFRVKRRHSISQLRELVISNYNYIDGASPVAIHEIPSTASCYHRGFQLYAWEMRSILCPLSPSLPMTSTGTSKICALYNWY